MDGVSVLANKLRSENRSERRHARQILPEAQYAALAEAGRKPGKCLSKGLRNRRIISSITLKDGSRAEFHATKGPRLFRHG